MFNSNLSAYKPNPAPQKTLRILKAIKLLWDPINEWTIQQYFKMMLTFLSNFDLEAHMFGQVYNLKWSDLSLGLDDKCHHQRLRIRGVHIPRHALAEMCPVGALGWAFFISFGIMNNPHPNLTGPRFLQDSLFDPTIGVSQVDLRSTMTVSESGSSSFYLKWYSALTANKYTPLSVEEEAECKLLYQYNYNRINLGRYCKRNNVYKNHIREMTQWMFPWYDYVRGMLSVDTVSRHEKIAMFRCLAISSYLAEVVLQDAIVLYLKNPDDLLLSLFHPFCNESFKKFASGARVVLEHSAAPKLPVQRWRQRVDRPVLLVNNEAREDQSVDENELDEFMDSVIDWSSCEDAC
ncbi:hypothetical protein JR316_0008974 [Psilocybe cubensis]|uniref:Uncharacterized protein n=2 Tax=Psilocybe cubensis TaxID=181762 RepID=A0A8H7XW51_PSICU|nr:hypothetical protein JR316_0008974 [Psilocybe cubensis]KAH9478519.1 hypothetical protein JR316_0008974 [Psilocybe cubensis]